MHPNLADRFAPILEAISVVQNELANKRFEDFRDDQVLRFAIERAIGIVSESSRRIPQKIKAQRSDIDWQRLAAFAQYLREHYYEIKPRWVWDVVASDLPAIKEFAEQIIARSEQ